MRLLNIFAALSGLISLIMLTVAAHALQPAPEDLGRIELAAFVQLGAAAAVLAIANRSGQLNLVAGALIFAGAAISAGTLYALALMSGYPFVMLAPVGGLTLIAGWVVLVFTQPEPRNRPPAS